MYTRCVGDRYTSKKAYYRPNTNLSNPNARVTYQVLIPYETNSSDRQTIYSNVRNSWLHCPHQPNDGWLYILCRADKWRLYMYVNCIDLSQFFLGKMPIPWAIWPHKYTDTSFLKAVPTHFPRLPHSWARQVVWNDYWEHLRYHSYRHYWWWYFWFWYCISECDVGYCLPFRSLFS